MQLFYSQKTPEQLAKMSFATLQKHAQAAINRSVDLEDFNYALNVLQHCRSRLIDADRMAKSGVPNKQTQGDPRQNGQQHGGQHRRTN